MNTIYNCHVHVFTNKIVPDNFLPFGIVRFLSKYPVSRKLGKFLNWLNPKSSSDLFDRYASFMNIGSYKSQAEIFNFLKGFYPQGSKFIALSMDMEYIGAGKVPQDFIQQLNELSEIKKKYPEHFFPFICADPRRSKITDIVKKYIEEHDFQGIKLYPPLGYYPFDKRLYQIFKYAEDNRIPVISHCSKGGVHYRGKITRKMLVHPITGEVLKKKKNRDFTDCYTDPENYEFLLKDFPSLKICLAHFGGGREWEKYLATSWEKDMEKSWFSAILDLIKKHPNVYADVSYTLHNFSLHPLLKVILQDEEMRSRVLYGSDFYMVELDMPERAFSINIRAYLNENDYQQIVEINPSRFLSH